MTNLFILKMEDEIRERYKRFIERRKRGAFESENDTSYFEIRTHIFLPLIAVEQFNILSVSLFASSRPLSPFF